MQFPDQFQLGQTLKFTTCTRLMMRWGNSWIIITHWPALEIIKTYLKTYHKGGGVGGLKPQYTIGKTFHFCWRVIIITFFGLVWTFCCPEIVKSWKGFKIVFDIQHWILWSYQPKKCCRIHFQVPKSALSQIFMNYYCHKKEQNYEFHSALKAPPLPLIVGSIG